MPSFEELYPGRFLKAADFKGRNVDLVIEDVRAEEVDGKPKAIVKFKGKDKELVMVRTNAEALALCFGRDTTAWLGKVVTIGPATIKNPFKRSGDGPDVPDEIEAIRVKGAPSLTRTISAKVKRGRKEINVTVVPTVKAGNGKVVAKAPAAPAPATGEPPPDMILPGEKPDPDAVDL